MKRILRFLAHRLVFVVLLLFLQITALITVIWRFENYFLLFYAINFILSVLITLYIINGKTNPSYKIAWLLPVLTIPIFGTLFFIMFGGKKITKKNEKKLLLIEEKKINSLIKNVKIFEKLKQENLNVYTQANYIFKTINYPVYQNTTVEYFKIGEEYYQRLLEKLKEAKKYIFLEYFIIAKGKMWDSILEILKQKVKEGVEVRVMYDDFGCIMTLPKKYFKELECFGIKCINFNHFVPILSSRLNNRDHRKIAIIDGVYGFTGGINLADEYINEKERFGHWKDNGIMLNGEATWSLTVMFLSLWNYVSKIDDDYTRYYPNYDEMKLKNDGYVIPYEDTPLDSETVGENVYLNMIYKAQKSIYIMTPYLIIDNEMMVALCTASKSGIDVRIITPGIPDKKIVNEVTKAYYNQLIHDGVKIYEYTKGFVHAKTVLIDDMSAVIGTINMDFRSLYLHYENGVLLYKNKCIKDIKKDILDTIKISKQVSLKETKMINKIKGLKRAILRVFAPLM